MSAVLRTENLTKTYPAPDFWGNFVRKRQGRRKKWGDKEGEKATGRVEALKGVSFKVKKGEIYGLIGSNGAGKTTLMKMIAGIGRPDSGKIELFGREDLENQRYRISVLLDHMEPLPNMTVEENLIVFQKSFGIPEADAVDVLADRLGLSEDRKRKASTLSKGRKKKLSIAMALMGNPDFLILDEPMNGLDPQGMVEVRELFLELKEDYHMTILLSSHILGELSKMAGHYSIMKEGRLVEDISSGALLEKCRRYLRVGIRQTNRAVSFLEEKGLMSRYEVLPGQQVQIYDCREDAAVLNRLLNEQGFEVFSLESGRQDLEQYFMERLGGGYVNSRHG